MDHREKLLELQERRQVLQERRQELAKEREKNKDDVAFQIGRAIGYMVVIGVPLVGLALLVGAI